MAMKFSLNLDITVNGVVVTNYTYHEGVITLAALQTPANVQISELRTNITIIQTWIKIIHQHISTQAFDRNEFKKELERKNGKVLGLFKNNGTKVSDIEFDPATSIATFKTRQAQDLNFTMFKDWVAFLEEYHSLCIGLIAEQE